MTLPPKTVDMASKVYGSLTVIEYVGRNHLRKALWRCICACGTERIVPGNAMRSGNTRSCGCAKTMTNEEAIAAFWAKVKRTSSCWLWTGAMRGTGYGHLAWQGSYRAAHRVAYELLVGPIPDGLVLDHLCRTPACVNPAHLEPVTQRTNVIDRGTGPFAKRARQTHCKRGHEFTPENTYIYPSRGVRYCRTCHRDRESGRI